MASKNPYHECLQQVTDRIHRACQAGHRPLDAVRLLAVSKTHDVAAIRALAAAGQRDFGENYLQEALPKIADLVAFPLTWHFIGRIQGNKTRPIAEHFAWVHSLANLHHAERLSVQRPGHLPPVKVCIQVNISGEASKEGVAPAQLRSLIDGCLRLPGLSLQGFMAIPAPASGNPSCEILQQPFRALRELRDHYQAIGFDLPELSMGMSDDLEAAIDEGSTWVRVGTALFGSRTA
ncbi:MAG: YggS family pyridoxal phosphate-dependent enzyme [Pseudomonadota bacterium]